MHLIVNGEATPVQQALSVGELVTELKLVPETLLIEHNGVALRRGEWNSRRLHEADVIEFIRVTAGG